MISCLFWNLRKLARAEVVADLCAELSVGLLMLVECEVDPSAIIAALDDKGLRGFAYVPGPAGPDVERPKVFLRHRTATLLHVRDDALSHVTVRRLVGVEPDLLLVVAHLPSKLHMAHSDDRTQLTTRLGRLIRDEEAAIGHTRTVVVGDLNMNPFESGVVGSEGLHGVMTRAIAATGGREVGGEYREFFYNPMWQFFGERVEGPPGTYHSRAGGYTTYFWHVPDQVLVRPAMLECLSDVRIVHQVAARSLLTPSGVPDASVGSDHLPLLFTLNL